jgi:trehalose-6-phosphate synthase
MAQGIHFALEMDAKERRARMQRMRQTVKDQNIYRWAANLIAELCEVRLDTVKSVASEGATFERIGPGKVTERASNPPNVA